jgi:hypothetical protein
MRAVTLLSVALLLSGCESLVIAGDADSVTVRTNAEPVYSGAEIAADYCRALGKHEQYRHPDGLSAVTFDCVPGVWAEHKIYVRH